MKMTDYNLFLMEITMKLLLSFIVIFCAECSARNDYFDRSIDGNSQCSEQNNLFLLPGVLSSGNSNRGCLSRFGAAVRGSCRLQILMPNSGTVSPAVDLPAGDGGCVNFVVPSNVKSKLDLLINVRYAESNCTWESRLTARVLGTRVFLIQTERPRYRPGETVRFRILQLRQDLTPSHFPIEDIWLEGPPGVWGEGTRIAEWTKVRTRLGIAQLHYNIDKQPFMGEWAIHALASDGTRGTANFWVGDYELPPFQLTVRHSTKILQSSERLVWTVCVRYPWGEAVEGLLVIRLRGAGGSANESGVRTVVRTRAPRACHRHAIAAKRVGLNANTPPHVIVAHFSFQEGGTRIWQNTTVVSEVVDQAVVLEFIAKHKTIISPGLPYKLKIKATRYDDKPATNINITICRQPTNNPTSDTQTVHKHRNLANGSQTCENTTTDARGVARMSFTVPFYESFKFYDFEAMVINSTSTLINLQLPISASGARATLGAVTTDVNSRTLIPLYLATKIDRAVTVHFVIVTRGSLIYRWGATTQCPISNTTADLYYAHKGTYCRTGDYYDQKSGNLLRIMIPIKLTNQMCPDSHLIAYFYQNGELISATKHLEVEDCFTNKAELTWMTRQVAPKSIATLIITTTVPALCAISSLDVTVKAHQNIKHTLLEQLRKNIADYRNITTFDALCNLESPTEQSPSIIRHLASAGVRCAGGNIQTPQCSGSYSAPESLTAAPRIDFDESWLWRLVPVNANLTAIVSSRTPDSITRYSTTGLCVANNGLALIQPTVIQVFREFFLHVDVPLTLTRGDSSVLTYRLFNYLYETLPVKIEVTSASQIRVTSQSVTTCVKQRSSESRHVELVALSRGTSRITVKATVTDEIGVCDNYTRKPDNINNSDEIIISIKIVSEGFPAEEYRSGLLCGDGNMESNSEVLWRWSNDSGIIRDTETWKVWAIGDIVGPLLTNADSLTNLPRGCGEQNMARLATNLLALRQVEPHSTAEAVAKNYIATGFPRQMQFVHPSGGFSAFGGSGVQASTWLTAFSVRYLRHAHAKISDAPLPTPVLKAETWLISQEMENGCFRNKGQVFHRELKGALGDDSEVAAIALTAYVISSLILGGVTLPTRIIGNSLACLRALPSTSQSRVYAQALVTHCILLIHNYEKNIYKVNEAGYLRENDVVLDKDEEVKQLVGLLKMAKRNGNFVWWDTGSLSTSIEATGYALMALSLCPKAMLVDCQNDAYAAVRWLSTHRNMQGGFQSTQDTLIALEGLLSWSSMPSAAVNLNISASTSTYPSSLDHHLIIPASKSRVPYSFNMKPGDFLKIKVKGKGCALIQATRAYNTLTNEALSADGTLMVQVQTHTDGPFNCINNNTFCYCAAVIEVCVLWSREFPSMALLDVRLPAGYSADATLLYALITPSNPLIRRIETSAQHNRITLYLGSHLEVARSGHYCMPIHSVGPKSRTGPAYVTVLDYYAPYINYTQIYTIPEECPARISHKVQEELGPDNIFISARSIDGEIIITEDFAFQDLPDGIPLEDPLYDFISNLEIPENIQENITTNSSSTENNIKKLDNDSINAGLSDCSNLINATDMDISEVEGPNLINEIILNENIEKSINNDVIKQNNTDKIIENTIEQVQNIEIPNEENSIDNIEITDKESNVDYKKLTENLIKVSHKEVRSIHLENERNDTNDKEEFTLDTKTEENRKKVEKSDTTEISSQFSDFHVINSETDLDVPTGIEGPVPSFALPPDSMNIVTDKGLPPTVEDNRENYRGYNPYWRPYWTYQNNYQQLPQRYNGQFNPWG